MSDERKAASHTAPQEVVEAAKRVLRANAALDVALNHGGSGDAERDEVTHAYFCLATHAEQIAALPSPSVEAVREWPQCQCWACSKIEDARQKKIGMPFDERLIIIGGRFIACEKCGNKRCPHATFHQLECTGSNEPGQPGSRYGALSPEPRT